MKTNLNTAIALGSPQTDSASFVGKKFRVQDIHYGHLVSEHDSTASAQTAALARPYSRILKNKIPNQTQKARNAARKKAATENPDVFKD
jgi:hypothetical protein